MTNGIFERLRTWNRTAPNETAPSYPDKLAEFKITGIRDLTNGYDSREADFKAVSFVQSAQAIFTFSVLEIASFGLVANDHFLFRKRRRFDDEDERHRAKDQVLQWNGWSIAPVLPWKARQARRRHGRRVLPAEQEWTHCAIHLRFVHEMFHE